MPRTDGEPELPPDEAGGGPRGRPWIIISLAVAGFVMAAAAVMAVALAPPPGPGASPTPGPVASGAGLIALVDESGVLTTTDGGGGSATTYAVPGVVFGSPIWAPDGSRFAAIGHGADDAAIYVFDVRRGGPGGSAGPAGSPQPAGSSKPERGAEPVVIYRSADRQPFYLYWTPDGRQVAFLANDVDRISLRVAPADGSAPLDGTGPASIIRRGAPLYFDWEAADRLLLHVGNGSDAFVGEVGLDGASVTPAVQGTGDFRAASAGRDGRYLAYVGSGTESPGEIVVTSRDGARRHSLPVFGPAAFLFNPAGDALATIAADKPVTDAVGIPVGPLRLMDVDSGAVRTLLEGSVIGFFWSPDGRTIAALRLVPSGGQNAALRPGVATAARADAAAPTGLATGAVLAAASPSPGSRVSVAFVDVSTGVVRAERGVRLGSTFVNEILPYFDQYALSHRVWAPDSASILLPLVDSNGRTQLVSLAAKDAHSRPVADGVTGFWSP